MEPLVKSPVFVLTLPRTGSTLLRCILDSHPLVCAPDELHLYNLRLAITAPDAELSMRLLGFNPRNLEQMLWDRILHHELTRTRKRVFVGKDPRDLSHWERIHETWPHARFIFLRRHPGAIYASIETSLRRAKDRAARISEDPLTGEHADLYTAMVRRAAGSTSSTVQFMLEQFDLAEEAQRQLAGITVHYEDLVSDAEKTTREICDYLDVAWNAGMLDYGAVDRPLIRAGFDPQDNIKLGRIVDPSPVPAVQDTPAELIPACRGWGYL